MSAEAIIKSCLQEVPKAVAAGVVDMGSGMLLAVKTVDSHPQEVLDLVAAGTKDLFEGDNTTAIENMFKKVRGVSNNDRYFREVIVTSTNLIHVFGRLKTRESIVAVVIVRGDANLGLVLSKTRQIFQTGTV